MTVSEAEHFKGDEFNCGVSGDTPVEALSGVLKGERKGLESVDEALSIRRRFAAGVDMILVL